MSDVCRLTTTITVQGSATITDEVLLAVAEVLKQHAEAFRMLQEYDAACHCLEPHAEAEHVPCQQW